MIYNRLADAAVLAHLLWIVFLFIGGIWGRRHAAVRVFHICGLFLALVVQVSGWYCPLTYLEVYLRQKGAPAGVYAGSFLAHYAERLVYIDLSRGLVVFLTVLLCAANALLYARVLRRRR